MNKNNFCALIILAVSVLGAFYSLQLWPEGFEASVAEGAYDGHYQKRVEDYQQAPEVASAYAETEGILGFVFAKFFKWFVAVSVFFLLFMTLLKITGVGKKLESECQKHG
ncbi:MAG: hypothetical protein ACD_15C00205G0009 [uncultured bacterium]|nr:MAG: hypothetical protein ACD_15C00205G0009 [uncultured bacterium]HCU70580.1 hypothetical protein [Candidatus Moranbacteria bacterium]